MVPRRSHHKRVGPVICKTVSLDAGKVVNVQPRYARLRSRESGEIYGWRNIELISDRSFEIMD